MLKPAPTVAAAIATSMARLKASRRIPVGMASPKSVRLFIIRKKVTYAIGSRAIPKLLVGTASQNLAAALFQR